MHVYNTIIVLKEMLPVFPVAAASGTAGYGLATAIDRLLETEERGDLKILARASVLFNLIVCLDSDVIFHTSYAASLKKRESLWAVVPDQPLVSLTILLINLRPTWFAPDQSSPHTACDKGPDSR